MSMNFFHRSLTCPQCHEPHLEGAGIEKIDDIWYRCLSCGCMFRNSIDFNSDSFINTLKKIPDYQKAGTEESHSKIPLFWAVRSNALEEGYIEWVKTINYPGNFLITWPWGRVKFLPILLTEYLMNNPEKKAIVIDSSKNIRDGNNFFSEPNIFETFKQTVFIKNLPVEKDFDLSIKTEMRKKKIEQKLIKRKKMVECEIKKIGTGWMSTIDCDDDTYTRCKNRIKKDYERLYGSDCIRKLEIKKSNRKKDIKIYNENGEIDLRFTERDKYMGKLNYDITWLWDVLLNSRSMESPSSKIPASELKKLSSSDEIINDKLIFINEEEDPDNLFDYIRKAKADMIIIPNTDEFIKDRLFNGSKSRNLIKFLTENRTSIVLMFSNNRDLRHLYHLYDNPVAEGCNVTPHTIDSYMIMNYLTGNLSKTESKYPTPLSSMWEELQDNNEKSPETEYIEVEEMNPLNEMLPMLDSIQNTNLRKDLRIFVLKIQRTLLNIRGAKFPEVFNRAGNSIELNYENVINDIADRIAPENFRKINDIFSSVFKKIDGVEQNPLRQAVIEKIKKLLTSTSAFITLVVESYELRGVGVLFKDIFTEKKNISRFKFTSWAELTRREIQIPYGKKHFVIATTYPELNFKMHRSNADRFIFMGSKKSIEMINTIVNYRISEVYSRPLYVLSENESAPKILKEAMQIIGQQINKKQISKLLEDNDIVIEDKNVPTSGANNTEYQSSVHYSKIRAGDEAILLIDPYNMGMLVPIDASLSIKNGEFLSEKNLDEINQKDYAKELNGIEILLDPKKFHRSFRSIFIGYMLEHASNVTFRKSGYEWKGFTKLLDSSQKWILALRDAISRYCELNAIEYFEAENFFAEHLAKLQLNAGDPDYIKRWWSDFETLPVEDKEFYIYKIEHTKSIHDVQKIFSWINVLIPDMNISIEEGEKSYIASIFIQDFRRSILSGNNSYPQFQHIYKAFSRKIGEIVKQSQFFKVSNVVMVKIAEEVEQFKVLKDYSKYIDSE